ncbi:DISARM system SNF2-like helicase DrmD [Desulfoplanes sp. PS50]
MLGDTLSDRHEEHLVTLSSLDEDAFDEKIQVIWQLEPGARILENAGMPKMTGVDSKDRLDAFLDAVRWGAVTNADRLFLQSPFRSGISIEDYQLDPLVRALEMSRVNLLIADDVGLGKTIEAGLIIQEFLVRHRARTVFIVCPASLQIKWQTEMREKFGLDFRIVDTEYIHKLRRDRGIHVNPWTSFPRLITSMDWVKAGEGMRRLKGCLPPTITYPRKFDILVVDEAHNVAPSTASKYALESQRTRAIRTMAPHFEHRLFLTATPHNGYLESFTSLLELLDDQRFARTIEPDPKQLQRVMVRRLKNDIVDEHGNPVFPVRKLETLDVEYTDDEGKAHELLSRFTASRRKSVRGTAHAYGTEFIHKLLKKRLFSSPMAFAGTLEKYRLSLEAGPRGSRNELFDNRILRKAIERVDEDNDDFQAEEIQHEALETAVRLSVPLAPEERDMLRELSDWAEKNKSRADSKARAILNWLENELKTDGTWNGKRVILFTEYRATHGWLEQMLAAHRFAGERLMSLHGGTDPKDREVIKAAFQAHPDISPVRILLATDAASEGIDLQNHCNNLIHVEIPWNPNVMEQRNGRIDRHGQKEPEVFILHPVGKGFEYEKVDAIRNVGQIEGDHEFLMRAVQKVANIREDLGSVGPVIARQIEAAMLGKGSIMDTGGVEKKAREVRKSMAGERRLKEKIANLHDRLMEAKNDFHLSPDHISRAVETALELAGKPPLKPVSLPGVPENPVFEPPILPGSWGKTLEGLNHPHTQQPRPITFDHDVAKGRDDVVLAHLNHPLVQRCLRLLREELWKWDDVKKLHRVTVATVPNSDLTSPVVIVWSRLVIVGGDHHRLHEEITLSGGELKHTGFSRITRIGRLNELVELSSPVELERRTFEILAERFERNEAAIRGTVEARSRDRMRFLQNTLSRRRDTEISNMNQILEELDKNIRKEMHEETLEKWLYLPIYGVEEQKQIQKDIRSLKARLARIPEEKELEAKAIERRYAGLTDRTFPVAVAFLVPESQMGGC